VTWLLGALMACTKDPATETARSPGVTPGPEETDRPRPHSEPTESESEDPPDSETDDETAGETGAPHTGDDPGPDGLATGPFVIGFWCGPPAAELTAARVAEIAAAGFTRVSNACDAATYEAGYNTLMLELAADYGLDAVVTDTRGLDAGLGVDPSGNLAAVLAAYGGYPALAGVHVYDEPGAAAFPALADAVRVMAGLDPSRFVSINLLPDYASAGQLGVATYGDYVSQFVSTVGPSFFTYDHYNFLSDGTNGASFFANLASVRERSGGVPWGQYIQAISYVGHRATTGPEKRWAALHTLAYGGTGVYYFTYWTPPQTAEAFGDGIIAANGAPTSQYADVADINRTLRAMLPTLAGARSSGVFHAGALEPGATPRAPGAIAYVPSAAPLTVGVFETGAADALVLVVNRDTAHSTTSDVVFAAGAGGVAQVDVATGVFAPVATVADPAGARLTLTLAPGDGALFHLPGPLPEGPVGAEAYLGVVRADAGWLDVVDARFGASRLRAAGWDDCPTGTTLLGRDFQSNGFWLCAPDARTGETYYVGNVVGDAGTLYRVTAAGASNVGPGGWDTCPEGALLGTRFESNGYWVCST
jgi:hypothetical protein